MEVVFRPITAWALPPEMSETRPVDAQNLYETTGWIVRSPLDLLIRPAQTPEAQLPAQDRAEFEQATGLTVDWQLGAGRYLWSEVEPWLLASEADYRSRWGTPFYPLGLGYFDWRLGFEVRIPLEAYLLIAPIGAQDDLQVEYGLLNSPTLDKLNADCGLSIVVRPVGETRIRRGRPIAKLFLIDPASLAMRAIVKEYVRPVTISPSPPSRAAGAEENQSGNSPSPLAGEGLG